jgi:hypothetical protein
MIFQDVPSTHRFALCVFLPDPPRGPVPACHLLSTGRTAAALAPALAAVVQLAVTRELAWLIPGPDLITSHRILAAEATYAVLPLEDAKARVLAHLIAIEVDFHDWIARNTHPEGRS